MLIWHLIDSSGVGGAERHVATVAGSLRRAGHSVEVLLLDDHGRNPWFVQLDADGISYRVLDGRLSTLFRRLRLERPSILHTHGYKGGILGRFAARFAGVPVVATFHSGARGAFPVGLYDFVDDWTSFLGARIAVSEAIHNRLPFSSAVIPSYVVAPPAPVLAPLPDRIGFVGRLSPEKGPDLFCALARRFPACGSWHIYGDGPMRAELEAHYGSSVTFHGVQAHMERVWPTLGLLVMPSRSEGVPLAALEAQAAGVPVLAARVGGLPSVIADGKTGWLYATDDPDAAGSHLATWQLARATGGRDLRSACWRRVQDQFSEARWFPELMKVYAGLVSGPVAGPKHLRGKRDNMPTG